MRYRLKSFATSDRTAVPSADLFGHSRIQLPSRKIDGYFVCALADLASGELTRKLNLLDPYKIWTWDPRSRQAFRGYPKKQLPMWHRYRIELYPHVAGFFSGIRDPQGNELEFPSAFRQSRRDGRPRGIIKLKFGEST